MTDGTLDEDGYRGPARLVFGERQFAVEVDLRGHFQPIDGRYHWYGRITANPELSAALSGKKRCARLHTPQGEAAAELSDPDPWDRYRVSGVSTPPFRLPVTA